MIEPELMEPERAKAYRTTNDLDLELTCPKCWGSYILEGRSVTEHLERVLEILEEKLQTLEVYEEKLKEAKVGGLTADEQTG